MHRRGLASFLAAALSFSIAAPGLAANNPFPDLPADHWAYDSVTELAAAGLVEGYPDGTFGGDRTFTRYEMAQVFDRILKRLETRLSAQIDQKNSELSVSLEKKVADAAAKAQEALAAALVADSKAGNAAKAAAMAADAAKAADQAARAAGNAAATADAKAANAASVAGEASTTAINAEKAAASARELAQSAYDLADAAKKMANELMLRTRGLEDQFIAAKSAKPVEQYIIAAQPAAQCTQSLPQVEVKCVSPQQTTQCAEPAKTIEQVVVAGQPAAQCIAPAILVAPATSVEKCVEPTKTVEQVVVASQPAAQCVAPAAFAVQCVQPTKTAEQVVVAGQPTTQCVAPAIPVAPAAFAVQCVQPTKTAEQVVVAGQPTTQCVAPAIPVAPAAFAVQCVQPTKTAEQVVVAGQPTQCVELAIPAAPVASAVQCVQPTKTAEQVVVAGQPTTQCVAPAAFAVQCVQPTKTAEQVVVAGQPATQCVEPTKSADQYIISTQTTIEKCVTPTAPNAPATQTVEIVMPAQQCAEPSTSAEVPVVVAVTPVEKPIAPVSPPVAEPAEKPQIVVVQGSPAQTPIVLTETAEAKEAKIIAMEALRVANDAKKLAEQAMGKPDNTDFSQYWATVNDALETAKRAEELAKRAATPEQVAEANALAGEARKVAELAAELAKRAAQLEDVAVAMSKAEEASEAAAAADSRARAAQITADEALRNAAQAMLEATKDRPFVLDDQAKKAIEQYVAGLLVNDMNEIRDNSAALAKRVEALEGKAISANQAEEIANRVVAEQLASALGRISNLEQANEAVKGDLAATKALVEDKTAALADSVEKLSTEFKDELKALGVRVSDLELGMGKLNERTDALEVKTTKLDSGLQAQGLEVQKLGAQLTSDYNMLNDKIARNATAIGQLQDSVASIKSDVDATKGEVAAVKSEVAATKTDVSTLKAEVANTQADVSTLRSEVAATKTDVSTLKAEVANTQADVSTLKTEVAATKSDVSTLKTEVASTKATVAAMQADAAGTKADIATMKNDLSTTMDNVTDLRNELGKTNSGLSSIQSDLAPIKARFDNTKISVSTDLVTSEVDTLGTNNSLFTNPREYITPSTQKTERGDWYNNRVFAKDESYLKFGVGYSTVPAPDATLDARIFAKQPLWGESVPVAGVEMDLTTEGVLRSLHAGELNGTQASLGFNKYVLDSEKWAAQLWHMRGVQALLQGENQMSANILVGYGDVKRVDIAGGTGNDLAGDDKSILAAASLQVPVSSALQLRANWLDLPVDTTTAKAVSVSSFEAFGEKGTLNYDATVAMQNNDYRSAAGEINVGQQIGNVSWLAEYGYNGDANWKQRLAEPEVDGLVVAGARNYGLEIKGLNILDFNLMLAHRYTQRVDKHVALLVRGERDFNILLPIRAVAEVGGNSKNDATQATHWMVDLGVNNWSPFSKKLSFDAGFRTEVFPIEADEWALRWRNIDTTPAPNVYQNWIPNTTRNVQRAKVTWHLAEGADLYVGGRWQDDNSVNNDTITSGLSVKGTMFGLLTTAGVEVENVSAYDDPKQSYVFSLEKAVGESTLSAGFKVNRGRGNDTASQEDATATLSVKMPLYEGTSFHVDGKYAGAKDNAASAYRNGSLLAGVTVTF